MSNPLVTVLRARGVSSEKLARLVDISASYAFQLRRGTVPSEAVRARIALALGVDTSILWPAADETSLPSLRSEVTLP